MRVPYEKLVIAVQGYGGRYYEVSPAGLPLLRPYLTDEEYQEMVRRARARWSEGWPPGGHCD